MIKKFFCKENGSITLFVLIAMLFFLFVVFGMFMRSSNSNMAQTSEVDQIKEEYEESVNNIDQIYNETLIENLSSLLKPGDFVNYTYDTVTDGYSLSSTYSGYTSNQTIRQTTDLQWQVLSVNYDGTVDLISKTTTDQEVYLGGVLGYNNGVFLMNDICKQLYSNSSLGIEARSINIEDIENKMNTAGITAKNAYIYAETKYGNTKTYGNVYYPDLYIQENGSGINSTQIKTNGINQSDNGYSNPTTKTSSIANEGLTLTQTFYTLDNLSSYFDDTQVIQMLFTSKSNNYWLASRYANCDSANALFGLYYINPASPSNISGITSFSSDNSNSNAESTYLCPIITLDITQIQPCTGTADGTDTTITHMHQIKE